MNKVSDKFIAWSQKLHQKYRWLEVTYPVGVAAFFIVTLAALLYSGNPRDQLATNLEGLLIRSSLKGAVLPPKHPERTVVISETEDDLKNFPLADKSTLKGVRIDVYAKVLDRILAAKPEVVYFSWLSGAQSRELDYLRPVVDSFKRVPSDVKVYVPFPLYEIDFLPKEVRESMTILEGDDCRFDVQSYCAYDAKEFENWVIQNLTAVFWNTPEHPIEKYHLSTNLPHSRPMFLLNLPDKNKLQQFSFSEVLDPKFDLALLKGRAVFVGSSVVQPTSVNGDNELLQRIFIPQDNFSENIEQAGTPYHVIWALVAQMFIDERTVAVPPGWVTDVFTVVLCLCILFLLWKVGAAAALAVFLLYSISYPYINQFSIRFFQVYLPMFDAIYVGLNTFLLAAFGKLSYQLYRKWRLDEKASALATTADLKGNFISLISHNLNTPIAKMQGLLDVLQLQAKEGLPEADIKEAAYLTAQLQLSIKAVLIATAVEEGSLSISTLSLHAFQKEFQNLVGSTLAKLHVAFNFAESSDEDLENMPVKIDARAVVYALASCLTLFKATRSLDKIDVAISASVTNDRKLEFSLVSRNASLEEPTRALLLADERVTSRRLGELEFIDTVHLNLVKCVLQAFHGRVLVAESKNNLTEITMVVEPLP